MCASWVSSILFDPLLRCSDSSSPEWCVCGGERRVRGKVADLGCDGEEELAALADLTFDPHASGHEGNDALGDGQP